MAKQTIKLTESEFHSVIKETVRKTILEKLRKKPMQLNECGGWDNNDNYDYSCGGYVRHHSSGGCGGYVRSSGGCGW